MAREHQIYWLSTEESGEDGVGRNWYYLKDARKQAQQLANELNTEVYINQGENIVDVMYPDIFRTLKHYSAGFHRSNPPEINKIYDEKVREVAGRIYADLEHAPEIIAEEFAKCEVLKWRRAFTEGRVPTDTYTAVWKAIDNISMALVDTTPLKNK